MNSSEQTSMDNSLDSIELSIVSAPNDSSLKASPRKTQWPTVHLPIDAILKRLQRVKSFVLGIGSVGANDVALSQSIVHNLVSRCSEKTNRKAILVSIRDVGPGESETTDANSGPENRDNEISNYSIASWSAFGESKAASKAWHTQLGDLPRWKHEFGLIVLDMGEVASPQMPRVGRLCDGIVVQLYNPADSRITIHALKFLTQENLPILGAWSVGSDFQRMAG